MNFKKGDELEVIDGCHAGRKCWFLQLEPSFSKKRVVVSFGEDLKGAFTSMHEEDLKRVEKVDPNKFGKFKIGDPVIHVSRGSGVVCDSYLENCSVKSDDGIHFFWCHEDTLQLLTNDDEPKLTAEQLNTEYQRRDGGEFFVTGWCEQMKMFLGAYRLHDKWCYASWNAQGEYTIENHAVNMELDLIKKPVVREFEVHGHIEHLGNRYPCVSSFKEENGVTELLRVEVIK